MLGVSWAISESQQIPQTLYCDLMAYYIPYHTMPYHMHYTLRELAMLCYAIPYHATPYHTTDTLLCWNCPCYTISFHAIPYHRHFTVLKLAIIVWWGQANLPYWGGNGTMCGASIIGANSTKITSSVFFYLSKLSRLTSRYPDDAN